MTAISLMAKKWMLDDRTSRGPSSLNNPLGMSWSCHGYLQGITELADYNAYCFRVKLCQFDSKNCSISDDDPNW